MLGGREESGAWRAADRLGTEKGVHLKKWRFPGRYYAMAILTAPVTALLTLLALSCLDPQFMPKIFTTDGKGTLLLMGTGAGLFIAFFEELGWTGYAVPRLPECYGVYGIFRRFGKPTAFPLDCRCSCWWRICFRGS